MSDEPEVREQPERCECCNRETTGLSYAYGGWLCALCESDADTPGPGCYDGWQDHWGTP